MTPPTEQEIKDAAIQAARNDDYDNTIVQSVRAQPLGRGQAEITNWRVTMEVSKNGKKYHCYTTVKWIGASFFAEPTIRILRQVNG